MYCNSLLSVQCLSTKKRVPLQKSHDNFQKQGVVAVNHMNRDVAEVNGSDPPMLPGAFLYEKEPGYEASQTQSHSLAAWA